jgi:hypothetical protein
MLRHQPLRARVCSARAMLTDAENGGPTLIEAVSVSVGRARAVEAAAVAGARGAGKSKAVGSDLLAAQGNAPQGTQRCTG